MATKTIIEIGMKGYIELPVDDLDRQIEILTTLKTAHTSGDYGVLLKLATVEEVKAEQKRRRFEDDAVIVTVAATATAPVMTLADIVAKERAQQQLYSDANDVMDDIPYDDTFSVDHAIADPVLAQSDEDVPEFLTKPRARTGRNG